MPSRNGGLYFSAKVDIKQAMVDIENLKKSLKSLRDTGNVAPSTKNITSFKDALIDLKRQMLDAQVAGQKLRNDSIQLTNAFKQGRIDAQQLAAAEKQARDERRALAEATRAARLSQVAASGSYDEAAARLKALDRAIRSAAGGFNSTSPAIRQQITEYNRLSREVAEFDAQMGRAQQRGSGFRGMFSAIGGDLKAMALDFVSVTAALAAINQVIQINSKISDSMSDVRRTAGLTSEEVEALVSSLKKIDTRTSLGGLLDIAVIGGQLGIAKEQLAGFTKAIDQLAVSLGGELQGGAEGIAKSLGVLDNVFKVTQTNGGNVEKSFNQIGSAILGLGQSGLATGDFLADFGERVGGVAKQAGLSLPVVLSYGAVLQESGVSAEVAGTSFKRLISLMATRRDDFYVVAKMADSTLTLKEFTRTINSDTQKALELFFNGLRKGGNTTTAFLDILKGTGLSMSGVSQAVAALSNNQQSLNGHIVDATRDFNNATLSTEQFAIKNDNLAASIAKLKNELENDVTSGSTGGFFKTIVDGLRTVLATVEQVISKFAVLSKIQSGQDLYSALFYGPKTLNAQQSIRNNYKQSNAGLNDFNKTFNPIGASPDLVKSVLSDKPLNELKALVTKYDALTKQAEKSVNDYNNGIKDGIVSDGGEVSLAEATKNFTGLKKTLGLVSAAYVEARDKAQKANSAFAGTTSTGSAARTAEFINTQIKALEEANKSLDIHSKEYARNITNIKKLEKELSLANGGKDTDGAKAESEYKAALGRAKTFSDKLTDLHNQANRKEQTADEQQLQAIRDKYATIQKEADDFYNNPKNARATIKINGKNISRSQVNGTLKADQVAEEDAVTAKTRIEEDKRTYEAQKQIYIDYLEFKTTFGEKQAKEMLANQLKGATTYVEFLENIEKENAGKSGAYASQVADFLKTALPQARLEEGKRNGDFLKQVLKDTQSYQSLLEAAREQHNARIVALGKNASAQALADEDRTYKAEIDRINEQNSQKIAYIQHYNSHVLLLTRQQAENEIKTLEEVRAKSNLDPKQNAEITQEIERIKSALGQVNGLTKLYDVSLKNQKLQLQEQLATLTPFSEKWKAIKDDIAAINLLLDRKVEPDQFGQTVVANDVSKAANVVAAYAGQVQSSFNEIANAVGSINEGLADTLSTIADIAGVAANAATAFGKFASGDIVGGIAGTISTVVGVINIFGKAKESAKKAAAEIQAYQDNLLKTGITYNALLRERARSQQDINELTTAELKARQAMLKLQDSQAKQDYNRLLSQIQGSGQQITGEHTEKYGGFLGIAKKTRVVQDLAGLGDADYNKLEELYTKGALTDSTKAWFEELKKAKDELDNIGESAAQAAVELNRIVTGTTSSDIAKAISDGFTAGKRSAADFVDTFNDLIQKGLLSKFENDFLKGKIDEFYKQYAAAASAEGGLTDSSIAGLRDAYSKIIDDAAAEIKNIEKVTGKSLTTGKGETTTARSEIRDELTETTGTKLYGVISGTQVATLQSRDSIMQLKPELVQVRSLMTANNSIMGDLYRSATDRLFQLQKIQENTFRTANNTDGIAATLNDIKKNTTPGPSTSLRGLGLGG